jgi:hypothetical protein
MSTHEWTKCEDQMPPDWEDVIVWSERKCYWTMACFVTEPREAERQSLYGDWEQYDHYGPPRSRWQVKNFMPGFRRPPGSFSHWKRVEGPCLESLIKQGD